MKEEKMSIYRIFSLLGIVASAIGSAGILCINNKIELDKMLCVLFVILGFVPIIVFELEFERNRKMIANNSQTNYSRVATGFLICSALMVGISYMPIFFRPVLLISLIMVAFSNETLGITIGLFENILLIITTSGDINELLAYTMMVLVGALFAKCLKQKEYRMYISLIFLFVSVLFPNLFYYLSNEEIDLTNLILCLFNGIIIAIYVIAFYPKEKTVTDDEILHFYGNILEDDFIQIRELRNYSNSEYRHARKVSKIARKYAKDLKFDADLASAAGFYYRLGRWEGDPVIENGVRKAQELCFPERLIEILSEYNGEEKLPSTPESALVHIIDGLLIKLELLEKEVGTSQWNREVLIYQTLNDFSTAGLYDESGLSINAFIKIREWLAKEEML